MRTARDTPEGEVHHVISRFIDQKWFLTTAEERSYYLRLLGNAMARTDWSCLAFALMSSHIHLAMVAGRRPSSSWSRRVNPPFVNWYNEVHERIGPMFAGRATILVERTARVGRLLAYIHNNPVRGGVVRNAADSLWTSHRAYVGAEARPEWLNVERGLELSGLTAEEFDDWVAGQRHIRREDMSLAEIDREAKRLGSIVLGTPKVAPLEVPLLARPFAHLRPNPGRIVEIICEILGLSEGEIFDRRRGTRGPRARAIVIQVGCTFGVTMSASGDALGISPEASSRLAARALDKRAHAVVELAHERLRGELDAALKKEKASPGNRSESLETDG